MTDSALPDPEVVELAPQHAALLRERVPMTSLGEFFGRSFGAVMAAATAQGAHVTGPPLGVYFEMAGDAVDVGAGFPVDAVVNGDGIATIELPVGRAAQVIHHGAYDELATTYAHLTAWLSEQGLSPGPVMWEAYLNEPDPAAPEEALTQITVPIDG